MKKKLIAIALLVFIITACSPEFQPTEAPANEAETEVPTVEPEQSLDTVEVAVVKQLASNLGLKESDISVVSNETVEFSDSCLGITMQDVKCAQVTTPGRIVMLEANNIQYEYHYRYKSITLECMRNKLL